MPTGVANQNLYSLLDTDECGIFLETANRGFGKAYKSIRVREEGPYGHSQKFTLIMTIEPNGWLHAELTQMPGTSGLDFHRYILRVLARLALRNVRRVFLWDNLSSHMTALTINSIYAAGHRICARPPYAPWDGPIEYVFNELEQGLKKRLYYIRNQADLFREIYLKINSMGANFHRTFNHCGYT